MPADEVELRIVLSAAEADDEGLAHSVGALVEELSELDVNDIHQASGGDVPPGSKGVELLALGALVVKLARSRAVLAQLVGTIRDWLTRNDADSVRIELDGDVLEIKGVTAEDKKALIDNWLERHSSAG
jgi:hypothetical protein